MSSHKPSGERNIVVLGAGVAGLHAALKLGDLLGHRSKYKILLIDKKPYHIIHSSLYHAVTARAHAETICLSLPEVLSGRPIEFVHDTAHAIDPTKQTIDLAKRGLINYDHLIIALGAVPNDYGIEGLTDHAFAFTTFEDAIRLRKSLGAAMRHHPKPRLVIGGGGLAGVELATAIATDVDLAGKVQIDLLEQASHVLSGFPRRLSRGVEHWLKKHKVDLYTNHAIQKVKTHEIVLDSKRTVPYDLLVWTGGVKAHPLVKRSGFEVDKTGRAIVLPTLQARGYARVYIVGDSSGFATNQRPAPQTNPEAIRQGNLAAINLARQLKSRPPHAYRSKLAATVVTLGQKSGYLVFGQLVLQGSFVVKLRDIYELWYFSGLMSLRAAIATERRQHPD